MYCPQHDQFVHPEHIQRGYEIEDGTHVIVSDSDIEAIAPTRSKAIEIQEFVDRDEIGPAYYDRPYYLVPTGPAKPYRLLVETLRDQHVAGLAEFVMNAREHFVALQSIDDALCLMTLRYPTELREAQGLFEKSRARSKQVEKMLVEIEKNEKPFDPDDLVDEYQERIDRLIAKKKKKGETVEVTEAEEPHEEAATEGAEAGAGDLVAALEASLKKEKAKEP
jgi:DNA end-binding protein Ku